ncbi:hypothetical protein NQ314_014310, partial [Rhamnusium bicolor]
SLFGSNFAPSCVIIPTNCTKTKYRSYDGSCNNLKHSDWGMAHTRYGRFLPPNYGDGISEPTVAKSGRLLPGSRYLSLAFYPDVSIEDELHTLNVMQYGQIIAHDMSLTDIVPCCTEKGQNLDSEHLPHQCRPIQLSRDDPDYSRENKSCMGFIRTTTDRDRNCSNRNQPAEQLSQVSHYLDLSIVYGNDEKITDQMRQYEYGRLRVEIRNGDTRINQNTELTVLHVILLREHNRIADELARLNPHWSDEIIFQEARRIAIAEHQHITYYEWMPIILGKDYLLKSEVLYETQGFVNDYNENMNPSVLNEHANAAFRFFHTNIAGRLETSYGNLRLSDWNFRPKILEEGDNFDRLTRGLNTQHQMASDRYHDEEVTLFLFKFGDTFGFDLKAIDIQRNRDHGLASYNDARKFCHLRKACDFIDFRQEMSLENIMKLSQLYEHPDDVDLTVGGSLETNLPGTIVGPTFHCLIVRQFKITRRADRFWYENGGETGFTSDQLKEIRKSSISRLMCDNGLKIKKMQPRGFLTISAW